MNGTNLHTHFSPSLCIGYKDLRARIYELGLKAVRLVYVDEKIFPKRGLEEHAEELLADVPNYTDIEPEVQISEVVELN